MKILYIKAKGFRELADDFSINLCSIGRVTQESIGKDLFVLGKGIHYPTVRAITGKNGSGKTSVLSLISQAYSFLSQGTAMFGYYDFSDSGVIELEIIFSFSGETYKYSSTIGKNPSSPNSAGNFSKILSETLSISKKGKSDEKELASLEFKPLPEFDRVPRTELVSGLNAYFKKGLRSAVLTSYDKGEYEAFPGFFDTQSTNPLFSKIMPDVIKIFDDSFEYIKFDIPSKLYITKRINEKPKEYTDEGLRAILSDGTKKGIWLFGGALVALLNGGTLIVDEIEDSFSRSFVFNLINLFMDDMVNTKHADLIFTTHYSSLLDVLRTDAIHVCYVKDGMCNAYNVNSTKPDSRLILSKQFDDNVFETQANGEYFGKVRADFISLNKGQGQ